MKFFCLIALLLHLSPSPTRSHFLSKSFLSFPIFRKEIHLNTSHQKPNLISYLMYWYAIRGKVKNTHTQKKLEIHFMYRTDTERQGNLVANVHSVRVNLNLWRFFSEENIFTLSQICRLHFTFYECYVA